MCGVNFFVEESKSISNQQTFGLCDDENNKPAYIDENIENRETQWIGEVLNEFQNDVSFYPIDNCVPLIREDGTLAKRCEGLLCYSGNIVFTELKNRKLVPSDWLGEAMEQLKETIEIFSTNNTACECKIKAWACNKQLANQNYFQQVQKFKEDTKGLAICKRGCVLSVSRRFDIK